MIGSIISIFALIMLAGIFKGFLDALKFHYKESFFIKLVNKKYKNKILQRITNEQFWNPLISSSNKYNKVLLNEGIKRPKFYGSTTFLVWLTDGLHLIQMFCLNSLFLAFGISFATNFVLIGNKWITIILATVVYAILFKVVFEITYSLSYKENNHGK